MIRSSLISSDDTADTDTRANRNINTGPDTDMETYIKNQWSRPLNTVPITTSSMFHEYFLLKKLTTPSLSFPNFRVFMLVHRGNPGSFADSSFHEFRKTPSLSLILQRAWQRHKSLCLSCHNITLSWIDVNLTHCSSPGFVSLFVIFTTFPRQVEGICHIFLPQIVFLWGSDISSRSCSSLPALVLTQKDVAIGAVVFCHIESWRAEGDERTRNTHSNKTEASAKSPGEHARTRFHPCSDMVLTVDTGKVNRVVTELSGHD